MIEVSKLELTTLQAQTLLEKECVELSKRAKETKDPVESGTFLTMRDYYWELSEKLGPVRIQYRVESEYWDEGRHTKADPLYFEGYLPALQYYMREKEAIREFADRGTVTLYTERYVGRKKYDCIN